MQALLVIVDDRTCALPSELVRTIVPRVRFQPIEGAPPWIAGLMDLRGELHPVIDAARLLDRPATPETRGSRIVVLDTPTGRADGSTGVSTFGLLVARVLDRAVLELGAGAWQPSASGDDLPLLSTVGRVDGRAVPLLDPRVLVRRERLLAPPAVSPTSLESRS